MMLRSGTKAEPVRISLPESQKANIDVAGSSAASRPVKSSPTQDKTASILPTNGIDNPTIEMDNNANPQPPSCSSSEQLEAARPSANTADGEKVFHLLLCVTGSVATIKLVELVQKIKSLFPRPYTFRTTGKTVEASIKIKIVMTQNSQHFAKKAEIIKNLDDNTIELHDDQDEWDQWANMGDPVLHIELRKWADLCLIAPLDANTMAKMANGICDNLLTCIVRAWDVAKPLVYCPAMNVHMYNHPITREQLSKLQSYGYLRVDCVEKRLACGDIGMGGMAPVETIATKVVECLYQSVARKTSLTRPLLCQQPTYPIISTSDQHVDPIRTQSRLQSSLSSQILNRFRTSNQISVHAVTNSNSRRGSLHSSLSAGLSMDSSQKRRKIVTSGHSNDKRPLIIHRSLANVNGRSSSLVTSVRNLKNIGLDGNGPSDCNDELGYNAGDEDYGFNFDPSKLLEQTMITDESSELEPDQMNSTERSDPGHSSESGFPAIQDDAFPKLEMASPLFNTSKFLALCHNKERGCYTCTICKHDYKNRKSMARHLKEQHVQGNIYHCKPCGVSYKRREKLIKHNRERHGLVQ